LTDAERALLVSRSGREPVSRFIKRILFADASLPKRQTVRVVADQKVLGQLLALLGQSSLATNVRVLAHQASVGVINCDEATAERLSRACREITELRDTLMVALGKEPRSEVERAAHIAALFAAAVKTRADLPSFDQDDGED
jgi:CTP:molybdopterin cytidylyltransferase MocA